MDSSSLVNAASEVDETTTSRKSFGCTWSSRRRTRRRRGHDPDEAVRIARIEAGGSSQAMEALRDQRGLPWLEDMAGDVSHGLRMLKRHPGFTATAMLSLALGIGANTGIFSLLDQALFRLLPVQEPERLVLLNWNGPSVPVVERGGGNLMSYPLCRDLQEQERFFDGVFCRSPTDVNFSTGQQYQVVTAEMVSGFVLLRYSACVRSGVASSAPRTTFAWGTIRSSCSRTTTGRTASPAPTMLSAAASWSTGIR